MSGEGMLALWGALKSVIRPGDVVLALSSGIFGTGIGGMAKQIGAEVTTYEIPFDEAFHDYEAIRAIANKIKPKLITCVHCETPSGTLNPLGPISDIVREVDALFYVDFVSSGCAVDINIEKLSIDLGLLGTQKVISTHPGLHSKNRS
jgi:aspartate aminotransferase-like enzyme